MSGHFSSTKTRGINTPSQAFRFNFVTVFILQLIVISLVREQYLTQYFENRILTDAHIFSVFVYINHRLNYGVNRTHTLSSRQEKVQKNGV